MKTKKQQIPRAGVVSAYRKLVINQFLANPYFTSLEQHSGARADKAPIVAEKRRLGRARSVSFAAPCTDKPSAELSIVETSKHSGSESC